MLFLICFVVRFWRS